MTTEQPQQETLLHAPNTSWILGWISVVSKWMVGEAQTNELITLEARIEEEREAEDLGEWEWVLSSTEEFLQRHAQWRMEKTVNELNSLQGCAQFKLRPYFMTGAVNAIASLSEDERMELSIPMDASKRSAVITDVVRKFQDVWGDWIREAFFSDCSEKWGKFESSYKEQPYSKNTIGILREVGWQASHGSTGTLPPKVLADIAWSICNALRGSIRGALDRELTTEELTAVSEQVSKMQAPLAQLWVTTVKNSKGGCSREGQVVRTWVEEETRKRKHLASLRGKLPKYEEGPVKISPWEHTNNKVAIAAALSSQLTFNRHM